METFRTITRKDNQSELLLLILFIIYILFNIRTPYFLASFVDSRPIGRRFVFRVGVEWFSIHGIDYHAERALRVVRALRRHFLIGYHLQRTAGTFHGVSLMRPKHCVRLESAPSAKLALRFPVVESLLVRHRVSLRVV